MLSRINPENTPDWMVLALAGFLVGASTAGIFMLTPAPVAEPSCEQQEQIIALPDITVPEAPKSVIERPFEDWLWMAPEEASAAVDEPDEPRRRRHRRRG